ncbi:hypothetical protein GPJ56_008415 [Histomonas meleagridis]|uniref:uncharacterized protein n=1 Tax=Histomonas meleagridis TaxID=135588 RepID=UPI003559911D|nr:hypothetical protein GPJ56_008415 [Histomonas meleagridis]KAH0803550.1 hypothetical protein GO595_003640 [Histomonas meleagridis]
MYFILSLFSLVKSFTPERLLELQNREQEEVCLMMKNQYIANSGWSWIAPSDTDTCALGTMNPETVDDAESRTNFYRNLVGLPSITYDRGEYQTTAQKGSMVMALNNEFSHEVKCKENMCCDQDAIKILEDSNLNKGAIAAHLAIDYFVQDDGETNKDVGHRNWLFFPYLSKSAFGVYETYVTQVVYGLGFNYSNSQDYVAYPPPGPVPVRLIHSRISLVPKFMNNFPTDVTGTVTCNEEIISKEVVYRSEELIVIEIDTTKINVGTRCKVSISSNEWQPSEYIEYEFWAVDCFPNYVCSSYYEQADYICSKEYSIVSSDNRLDNFYDTVTEDEINIILSSYPTTDTTRTPNIDPWILLQKNHLIKSEDGSPLWFRNTYESEIWEDEHTTTKLQNVYIGFQNNKNINLWNLEMKGLNLIGSKTPRKLTANEIITDTNSLQVTQNFLYGNSISIQNCEINQIEVKEDKVNVNGADVILNNFGNIEIKVTSETLTITLATDNMPKLKITSDSQINVQYDGTVQWENVQNKQNLVINGVPAGPDESQQETTETSETTVETSEQSTTEVTSESSEQTSESSETKETTSESSEQMTSEETTEQVSSQTSEQTTIEQTSEETSEQVSSESGEASETSETSAQTSVEETSEQATSELSETTTTEATSSAISETEVIETSDQTTIEETSAQTVTEATSTISETEVVPPTHDTSSSASQTFDPLFSCSYVLTNSLTVSVTLTLMNSFVSVTELLSEHDSSLTYVATSSVYYNYQTLVYTTNVSVYTEYYFAMTSSESGSNSLSKSALIGIICGAVVIVIVIVVVVVVLVTRSRSNNNNNNNNNNNESAEYEKSYTPEKVEEDIPNNENDLFI